MGKVIQFRTHILTGFEDVIAGQRVMLMPALGKQVTAEQGASRGLE